MIRPINFLSVALVVSTFSTVMLARAADSPPQAATKQNTLTPEELADGWILLFDGKTKFGWAAGSEADWKVADGVISVTSGKPGLLHTTTEFSDYLLRVDFRAPPETNSGVFLRTPAVPTSPTVDCYEANIAGPKISKFPTGSLVGRKLGDLPELNSDWHTYEIRVAGDRFTLKVDGRQTVDYTDPKPLRRGFIGLQYNTGKAEFRNVKLKPLSLKDLFDGQSTTGWRQFPATPISAKVSDGVLRLNKGPGQLESEQKFGDFVIQGEFMCNAKGVNSGLFFRCIPGELMNGYECQIENRMKNGDRTKPADCGTGGIYRRQDARRVVADDLQWFHLTLAAGGLHMAAWVNGYQVSDFTDTRPENENPRQGSRTQPGTLAIQVHDGHTDISLRSLRAVELPSR